MKKLRNTVTCALVLALFASFAMASDSSKLSSSKEAKVSIVKNDNAGELDPSRLVTPCTFTYDNEIGISIDATYLDSIPNDSLGLYTLPSGYRYLVVGIACTNGKKSDHYISTSDFQVYADNKLCDEKYILDDNIETSATISSGRSAQLSGFYAVPKDAKLVEIEFEPDFLSDKITIKVSAS